MKRNLYLIIAAILLTSCAVSQDQARVQDIDKPENPEPQTIVQDELLN